MHSISGSEWPLEPLEPLEPLQPLQPLQPLEIKFQDKATIFTRRGDIIGAFANSRLVSAAAILGTAVILVLNVVLILQTFGVSRVA